MKKIWTLMLAIVVSGGAHAQGVAELFQQGQTQTKYLMQQIAALQQYIGYVQKGYAIAQKGLGDIGNIKKGELELHTDYFNSLKSINPKVSGYAKVAAIIAMQLDILKIDKDVTSGIGKDGLFNSRESEFIKGVYQRLLDDCLGAIDELTAVTTIGQLEMKDNERIRRIDKLYAAMQSNYTFARSFAAQATALATGRRQEENDIRTSRLNNGIKQQP